MKKRLLVTASTFPRWEEDTEPRFVLDLSKALTKYFDVTVLAPAAPGAKDKEILEGVKVIRYHYFPIHKWETLCYPGAIMPRIKEKKIRALLVPFLILSLFWHLFKLLPNFDIVHSHWLIPQGIVQSFFKKPYIVTGHGGDVTSLNKGIFRRFKIHCLKKAKYITVVSSHLKDELLKLYDADNIKVIPMGCWTVKFDKKYAVPNFFHQGKKKVVLFVGRLAEKKGVTYLIDAMKGIDAILVIVGEGPLKESLEDQALEQGDKIKFLGAKSHEELRNIYASADVFVAPSITAKDGDQEGLPTAIIEAMSSGLPVIASDSGGISELIKNGENGILVKEKDSYSITNGINKLLNDSDYCSKIIASGLKTVSCYDYSIIAKKYADLLNE